MGKTSMEIVLSEDLKQRLHAVAKAQSKTVQECAQEALYVYVEDNEDGALSDVALAEEGLVTFSPEGGKSVAVDSPVFKARRKTA